MEFRSGQPKWHLDRTRIRRGCELDQFGPHVDPHRLRFIRPIRRLYRTLDGLKTVGKTLVFRGFSPPQLRRPASPNYTPSAPKLRLIATQVSDQIAGVKRRVALRCRGYRMSNRSVKFGPALLAGVVAVANLATMTDLQAQVITTAAEAATPATQAAADNCLSAPKGTTPSGSHWYYRIDRVTKRQCWYLREESDTADDKFARAAPPASAPAASSAAAEPAPSQQRTITRKSIADARAEWISQQPRAEPNPPAKAELRTVAAAAPAPATQNTQRATMPNVLAPAPLSSMRWNDAPATRSLANPANLQVAAANPPAGQLPQAEEVQQPAADQVMPAAADTATAKPTASLQKLLLVMAAALALAGLTVSAIVRIGRMRARRAMRRKRRAMWDSAKTRRRSPQPMFHDEDAGLRRTGGVHNPRVPQERTRVPQERTRAPQERTRVPQERVTRVPQERPRPPQERRHVPQDRESQVTEMLARLARSAQT